MLSPIATRDAIHLDAIVIDSIARRRGLGAVTREMRIEDIPHVRIPIPKVTALGRSAYLCSAGRYSDHRVGMERVTKKKDATDIHVRASRWSVSAGPERLYCVPVATIETPRVTWLCAGSRRQLRMAVRSVRHIGIMRRHGYGRVGEWEITETDAPPEQILIGSDGRAGRHLPAAWCPAGSSTDAGAVLPPYWHPGRTQPRVRFGHPAELNGDVYAAVSRLT